MSSPWVAWSFYDLFACRKYLRMSARQQAAYLSLLGAQAMSGPLPNDLDELAFLAARNTREISEEEFPELWVSPLSDCFEEVDGCLVNPRMAEEAEVASLRSSNARKAARERWAKERAAKKKAKPKEPAKKPKAKEKVKDSRGSLDQFIEGNRGALPAWVVANLKEWDGFRKRSKYKALKVESWGRMARRWLTFTEQEVADAVSLAMEIGYQGVFPKSTKKAKGGGWYNGAKMSAGERRTIVDGIVFDFRQLAGDFGLCESQALEMARESGDARILDLDWREGRTSSPPKKNSKGVDLAPEPTTIDVQSKPD